MSLAADVFRGTAITHNIIAETTTGDPNNVVMLGAHLDSVNKGPGINDNGSGSAAILEVALQMKNHKPNNKLRFAWWSAEESGLVGSTYYVDELTEAEHANLAVYLSFDMIGSPNFMRGIYDGDGSSFPDDPVGPGPAGSAAVETLFELYYSIQGLAFEGSEISFRSDYAQFFRTGIPFGGLFTGAESIKTPAQQALYGGTAGDQLDPCYHAACDNIDNLDHGVLSLNADAIALSALLFSYTTAPIDAQQAPVAARTFSTTSNNASKFDHVETWGKHYIK